MDFLYGYDEYSLKFFTYVQNIPSLKFAFLSLTQKILKTNN